MLRYKRLWLGALIVLAFLMTYTGFLRRNMNEKRDRSLELNDEVATADHVLVSITVLRVDPAARQLTTRLRFRPTGNIAHDAATPKINLKLHVNNSPGQQAYMFPEEEGMVRIEATFALDGDLNRYPFDRYETNIWLLMDMPRQPQMAVIRQTGPDAATQAADLAVSEAELRENVTVPLSISLSASTPGMKYAGEIIRTKDSGLTRIHLSMKRPNNLINTSVTVMCLIMGIALSVVAMVLKIVVFRGKFEVLPLSLCVSLIFGLPALRNIQPGVPPVGVLGDYFSFIWAEMFVAASAMITALTWVWRSEQKSEPKP